jgi:putative transposase
MSQTISPSAGRRYGLALACRVWEVSRSSLYASRTGANSPPTAPHKRGPKTKWSDPELTELIRVEIVKSPFTGEGYRKVWARLRLEGIRSSRRRILRLMREAGLLAPSRSQRPPKSSDHTGTITTERPDLMWGTDGTGALTGEGWARIFFSVDHCTSECVGIHATRRGTRFEALEPLRQGVHAHFGGYREGVASGLALRHDHGSQFMSDHYQQELRFLGIESSPAFVREPEGNGCSERFVKTLKEQLLWVRHFATVEELRLALLAFKDLYNQRWLVERHAYRTPSQVRAALREAA